MKGPIRRWNNEAFGNIDKAIKKFEEETAKVEQSLEEGDESESLLAKG